MSSAVGIRVKTMVKACVAANDENYGCTVLLVAPATGWRALAPDGTEFVVDNEPGCWFVRAVNRHLLTIHDDRGVVLKRRYACYSELELSLVS